MKIKNLLFSASLATASVLGAVGVANVAKAATINGCGGSNCTFNTSSYIPTLSGVTNGANLANGIAFKSISSSSFEIYTVLGGGVLRKYTYNGSAWDTGVNLNTGLGAPQGVALDSAGNIYVSGSRFVRKLNSNGVIQSTYTAPSGTAFQKIAISSTGDVYVTQTGTGLAAGIYKFTAANLSTTTATAPAIFGATTSGLNGLAIKNNTLYVAQNTGGNIQKIDDITSGNTLSSFRTGLSGPRGLFVDVDGVVYAANTTAGNVRAYNDPYCATAAGSICDETGYNNPFTANLGADYGDYSLTAPNPYDVATDSISKNLFVLNRSGAKIEVYYGNKTIPEADVKLPTGIVLLGLGGGLIWKMKKNQRKNQLSLTQEETTT
jgi:hypothetical protein